MMHRIHLPLVRTFLLFVAVGCLSAGLVFAITQKIQKGDALPTQSSEAWQSLGVHHAFPQDARDIDKNFYNAPEATHADVRAVVVNHHLLAGNLIAKTFASIIDQPSTIIVLSPNHFEIGSGLFTTSAYDWSTAFGTLYPDTSIIDELTSAGLVTDQRIFPNEHGITNIIPYIAHAFPKSKIVPIAIKTGVTDDALESFSEALASATHENVLLVASVDFSHSLTSNFSDFHDTQAESVLYALDTTGVQRTDVDSPATLSLLFRTLSKKDAMHFTLLEHANASTLTQQPAMVDVTSYLTGIYQEGKRTQTKDVSLMMLGDMMLDRYVAKHIQAEGFDSYFQTAPRAWLGSDITLANLEGCFTDFTPRALDPNNLAFTFDPDLRTTLKTFNFTTFSLANNHALNFGSEGLAQCKKYLAESAFAYYGHPKNSEHLSTIVTIRETTIGFVGYNALEKTPVTTITEEIKRIRPSVDYLIVTPHWGNEYQSIQSYQQEQYAHGFIDAGADLIVGTHPHVIQPIETYNGKLIFYSLGNFIFDQMFSEETRTGLGIGVTLTPDGISAWLYPLSNANFTIEFLQGEKRDTVLAELSRYSEVSDDMKSEIRSGYIH